MLNEIYKKILGAHRAVDAHRAVGLQPPINQAPVFNPAVANTAAMEDAYSFPQQSVNLNQIGTGTPAHGNIWGGGADISEKAGVNIKQILEDIAGLDLPSGVGGPVGGGGGGVGRGGGGGGGISAPNPISPIIPGISAVAPNPGFTYVLPRRKEDQYSGGL